MSTNSTGDIMEPTLWQKNGWTARVIKNGDDDGWAVEIRKAGIPEPVLISPWVMGGDKKNPKPFDGPAFATFVKTASEVLDRSARQRDAALKKKLAIAWEGRWYDVQRRDGMLVPMRGEVAWLTPQGRRPYWRGSIAALRYTFAG